MPHNLGMPVVITGELILKYIYILGFLELGTYHIIRHVLNLFYFIILMIVICKSDER